VAQKRVTMRQIAKAAGVSRTTVSFVLNDVPGIAISPETRQRIHDAATALNYIPDAAAQSLASRRAGAVALVLRQSPHQVVSDAFLAPVVQGIAAAVKEHGYHVLIEPLDPLIDANYGDLVRSRRADGILLSGPRLDDEELLRVHEAKIPLVLMGQLPGTTIPFVDVDNVHGAQMAVEHLIGLGHRRIACITNAPLAYTASQDRLTGYRYALEAAGIAYDESLIRTGDFTDESGAVAMHDILSSVDPLPSAVFVASDVVALGVLTAIQSAGLHVPEDIALVGFDDIPLAQYVDPPLTTIRLPAYGLGWGAGDMLARLVVEASDVQSNQILLETELIIRQSCGASIQRLL
jgi:DNA-binding LacI/PurR family transcriptional regulator